MNIFTPGQTVFWAGTQASFDAVLSAIPLAADLQASSSADSPDGLPPLWSKSDGVATVDISGSLIDGEAGWLRVFGITGYVDINNALVEAASDPEVKQILMHINSGGGQVNGVMELSNTIKTIGKVKPIDTHSSKMMASAAYWLGVNGRHISADQTAVVGSIGVLTVHAEMSQQLAQDGINVTVMRAGTHKALANKYEPLTEEAKAGIQGQLNDIYSLFIGHVADARGVTTAEADQQMGQGKEFLGKRALDAGLVDKIGSYDKVISFVKKIDMAKSKPDNSQNSKGKTMTKKTLTEAQLAQIEAGVPVETVMASAVAGAVAEIAVVKTELSAEEKAIADKVVADAAALQAETDAAVALAEAAKKPDAVMLHLTAQLAAANEAVIAAKVETASYKAAADAQESLLVIARGAVAKMSIALGGSAEVSATLDAKAVVAEHARISTLFTEKFKVGGVALSSSSEAAKKEVSVDPQFAQAVKSAPSFSNK